jgi:hypothetical protein
MKLGSAWCSIRGILRDTFSFAQIKDIVGAAGLPVYEISHLQQKSSGGASKGQLMDGIDGLVKKLDDDSRARYVSALIKEIVVRNQGLSSQLEDLLARVGWGIAGSEPYPLSLHIDLSTANLPQDIQDGVAKCMRRYRDGDASGAISAICGIIDTLTQSIYSAKNIGNAFKDSYQQRVSKAFSALEEEYIASLNSLDANTAKLIWKNHRNSVNQAAYILGAFRRDFSDVHGEQDAPPALVQRSLDCAVFIVRSMIVFIEKD